MARIRSIKPTFFMSRTVKKLSDRQKLVWIGLWPNADDHGRLMDEPGILAGLLWSLSLSERQIDNVLTELHTAERIIRYAIAGESYIQVTNWDEHQRIQKPSPSMIPPVPLPERSGSPTGTLPEGYRQEGRGKEGKGGGDAEPPRRCEKHMHHDNPPSCGACKERRIAADKWLAEQKKKSSPSTTMPRPSECDHPKRLVENGYCKRCGGKA